MPLILQSWNLLPAKICVVFLMVLRLYCQHMHTTEFCPEKLRLTPIIIPVNDSTGSAAGLYSYISPASNCYIE